MPAEVEAKEATTALAAPGSKKMKKQQGNLKIRLLAAFAMMSMAVLAQAQYVWLDEKGVKTLSDRPPPPTVPASRILKAPGATNQTMASEQTGAGESTVPAAKAGLNTAERNTAFLKRQTEAAAREQKGLDEAKSKAEHAGNCDGARQNQRLLNSGQRISTVDKNGERTYMSDEERTQQVKQAQRALADCR